VSDFAGFVRSEGAAEEFEFGVAEPFFDDLVAADGEIPNFLGNVGPASRFV
jgi:hypothetical protein